MIYREVTCPVCGCACDDIEVIVEDNKIIEVSNACTMGTAKFFKVHSEDRLKTPIIRRDGEFKEISWEEAIDKAADILRNSEYPLLYGFSETSCEAIKIGVDIAERLGGFIDNQTSQCHSPTIIAEQNSGFPLCTLGMAINYADLIVYWGSNPEESHPRHMSRFTTYPRGIYREEGRRNREIVVIDVRRTETAKLANYFYKIEPNKDFELIVALEMLMDGKELREEKIAGLEIKEVKELAGLLKWCEYGII
ncbi:MAG TPA: formylmethanofuran dehydrogenase subunit B, partial [Candidatus Altiarchaeales archaeon]|nr:formylmethanofuran dehydrogenase subunit B [Candidatus Altiarchaeales archaeon]